MCYKRVSADYVFTVSMNACSFGIGSCVEPGKVRVAHANSAISSTSYGVKTVADIEPVMIQQRKFSEPFLARQLCQVQCESAPTPSPVSFLPR